MFSYSCIIGWIMYIQILRYTILSVKQVKRNLFVCTETVAITNVSYQNRSQSNSLFWKVKDPDCFPNISYKITHYMKSNGVPDMSSCVSNVPVYNRENFTIQPLIPNSQYHLTIQAASVQYPETFSVVHEMDIFPLSEFIKCIFAKMMLVKMRNADYM